MVVNFGVHGPLTSKLFNRTIVALTHCSELSLYVDTFPRIWFTESLIYNNSPLTLIHKIKTEKSCIAVTCIYHEKDSSVDSKQM